MKQRKKKAAYPPELAKPMQALQLPHRPGLLFSTLTPEQDAENQAAFDSHWAEILRRMNVLRAFHGVADGAWIALAHTLAQICVPGLREASPAGRPSEWDVLRTAQLHREIDAIIAKRGKGFSVESAAKILAKQDKWKPRRATNPAEVLRRKYYEADPRWLKIVEHADAWDRLMAEAVNKTPSTNSSQEGMGTG